MEGIDATRPSEGRARQDCSVSCSEVSYIARCSRYRGMWYCKPYARERSSVRCNVTFPEPVV